MITDMKIKQWIIRNLLDVISRAGEAARCA